MRLKGVVDSSELIKTRAVEKKVLLLPGIEFIPNSANRVSPFVRASFSTATDEQMDEACRRLAELLQK